MYRPVNETRPSATQAPDRAVAMTYAIMEETPTTAKDNAWRTHATAASFPRGMQLFALNGRPNSIRSVGKASGQRRARIGNILCRPRSDTGSRMRPSIWLSTSAAPPKTTRTFRDRLRQRRDATDRLPMMPGARQSRRRHLLDRDALTRQAMSSRYGVDRGAEGVRPAAAIVVGP